MLARIGAAAGVCDLIAASCYNWKAASRLPTGRQLGGKIDEPMGDEVGHLALPLNAASHSGHAGDHHDAVEFYLTVRAHRAERDRGSLMSNACSSS